MTDENVIRFEQDSKFYLNLSKKSLDRGDMLGAIDYAKRAGAEGSEESRLCLAELFMEAGHYDKVLDVLNDIIADNRKCVPAFRLAFQFFLILDDVYSLLTYIKLGLDYNGRDPEFFRALEEVRRDFDFEQVLADAQAQDYRVAYPPDGGENSEELLENFDKNSFFYNESRNQLAQNALDDGRFLEAKTFLNEVLEEEPENVSALCTMVYLCNSLNRPAEAKRYVDLLLSMENVSDVNDVYKIVSVFCDMNDHDLVLKYLERIEEMITPDDRLLEIKALAYYNLNMLKESREVFRTLHVVDDTFYIYQYYLRWVDEVLSGEREFESLAYTDQVPESEYQFRAKKLEMILSLSDEDFDTCVKIPENAELLKWSLTMNEDDVISEIVKRMFRSPLESFLDDMLVYSDISYVVKKEIVCLKLLREDREIVYTISDIIRIRKSKYPKRYGELPPFFRRAFCMAQAMLYFTDANFFAKLCARVGRMFDRYRDNPDPDLEDETALTAALLFLTMKDQYPVAVLSRIFSLDDEILNRYIQAYR